MRRKMTWLLMMSLALALPAFAQFGDLVKKAKDAANSTPVKKAKKAKDIYTDWTPEQEDAIGQASAAKMIHIFGLYEAPRMARYVNLVGNGVAAQADRPVAYKFAILDTEAVTAYALPGGYVFITRGALANMRNEAELAGTLAHEVAHVNERHLEKQVRSSKTRAWAWEEGSSRIPGQADLANIANDIVNTALSMHLSRDKENDADRKGTELALKTGYDPAGLRNFIQVLAQASQNPDNRRQLTLWGETHPPYSERVASLNAVLEKYPPGGQVLEQRFVKFVNFGAPADELKRSAAPAAPATATAKTEKPAEAKKDAAQEAPKKSDSVQKGVDTVKKKIKIPWPK